MTLPTILAFVTAYLLGSIPFGLLVARFGGKGDIRDIGSGNIGATNVLRTGSKKLAALTLLLDVAKGTVAVLVAQRFWPDGTLAAAAGAMIGHLYPLWLGFKGGKGVATLLGVLIPLLPLAALIYALVWIGLLLVARISSLAGMSAAASAPLTAFIAGEQELLPMLIGLALLVIWRHRDNIVRLSRGQEPRIGQPAGPSPGQTAA